MKFIVLLITLSSFLLAQTPEEKGLEIAKEMSKRDDGFSDIKVNLIMTLRNQHGSESVRYMRSKTLEGKEDGDKSIIVFDKPADVKGTATLTYTHKVGSDDQWLYLPAIKRVKRISSNNKSGPFMGSEFAYEDLSSQEVEKYTYKYLKDEGKNFVMERYPVDTKSGYTKQVVWVDKSEYRIEKTDFYDRKNTLLKTLTFSNYKKYLEKYWRAGVFKMVNHQSEKSTILNFSDYTFKTGLREKDFSKNSLKRVR
jgi:outer membrane lipoprotein-sorting protein